MIVSLAGGNSHSLGTTANEVLQSLNTLENNQQQYNSENPDNLDRSMLRTLPAIEKGLGLAALGVVALSGDEDAKKQFAQDVETLFQDVNTLLGRNPSGNESINAEYIVNELIALKIKEDLLNESPSPNYQTYNAISEQRTNLTAGLSPKIRAGIEGIVTEFVDDFNSGSLTYNGGFQQADEPLVTAMPNPSQTSPLPVILDNTPPEISGQTGGFEIGEDISSNTETPMQDGHWSDNVYLSESGETSQSKTSIPSSILNANGEIPLGIGGLGTPVPMPQSSNPNEVAEQFAKNAFGGQEPKSVKYNITGPGSWVAELPDGTYVTFRPAGQASSKTSEDTATVEVNNSKIRELNNNSPAKFKFPKG